MKLKAFYGEGISSNSYLLTDDGDAVLVDCSVPASAVIDALKEDDAKLRYIILTHGHFDHIETLDELRELTGAKVVIHENDAEMLSDGHKNGYCTFFHGDFSVEKEDVTVKDGDVIKTGSMSLGVIHTPGHTKGSMCLQTENYLFTGDTLFAGNIGRCDLYGGDGRCMFESLRKLAGMDPTLEIYPGHGPASSMERELSRNLYIRDALTDRD